MWFYSVEKWLTDHAAAVQAFTAILVAIFTLILVLTTIAYLVESHKSRVAAENQASAALRSVGLLQQQLAEQLGLGRGEVQSAIDSALQAISYWKKRPLTDVAKASGLPSPNNLVPVNASAAVDHARQISADAAKILSAAFDDLRNAVNEIERTRLLGSASVAQGSRGYSFLE